METQAQLISDVRATLGEGSFWDEERSVLYWVDIEGREVRVYDPESGSDTVHAMADRPGTVVPRSAGGIVVALGRRVAVADEPGRSPRTICEFAEEPEESRMNDGKCDPAGRLWVGSMSTAGAKETSRLYCVEADGSYRVALTGVTISNGIVWTADEKTMYYIDTPTREVHAFDYDRADGAISNRRVAVAVPDGMGYPDGMTIDAEGKLLVAMFGGSAVRRFDPADGSLLGTVHLPVSNITSCALGGDDLRDLYITTARVGLSEEQRSAQPTAGGLFRARVEVPGVRAHRFAG
jgi:sugar lactone lactonase YvrE